MRISSLILFASVVALTRPVLAQDAAISDQAREHFQAGVNLMQDPDGARYEEAYREFSAAYQASPSWKILGNLGIAAMKVERDGEAVDAFEKYLAGAGSSLAPDERAQFERDLNTLKPGLVKLQLQLSQPGATIVDERQPVTGAAVRNIYTATGTTLALGVRSGHHRIVARLPGYEDASWEFEGVAGAGQSHTFEFAKVQSAPSTTPPSVMGGARITERPNPTAVYVGLAVTGALAIGAGVTGGLALGKKSDFDAQNDGSDPRAAKDLHDSTETLNLVTDVLIGAAVVSAGVTTYLYLSRPTREVPSSGWMRVEPQVGLGRTTLQLTGAF